MVRCPPAERLTAFVEQRLPQAESAAVAQHLDGCARCQRALELLTDGEALNHWRKLCLNDSTEDFVVGDRPAALLDNMTQWLRSQLPTPPPTHLAVKADASAAADPPSDLTLDHQPAESQPVPPGLSQVGSYEVLRQLGRGGMGVVLQAYDTHLKRMVALKMLRGAEAARPEHRQRLRREAEAVARLSHANIVQIYEVNEHEGQPYLVLELVRGGTLAELLRGRPQSPRESAQLLRTLAETVEYAHEQGIIHRDLKPSNVLLSVADRRLPMADEPPIDSLQSAIPKITDFGLAKIWEEDGAITETGAAMGTPQYMAPEQAGGRKGEVGPAADIYALGAIFYELLTGRPPFRADTVLETLQQVQTLAPVPPRQLQPRVPRDLETICLRCLAKEPRRRYGSAAALAADLQRFLEGRPIHARPVGLLERGWSWCRRKPALAGLVVTLSLLLVTLAVGGPIIAVQKSLLSEEARLKLDVNRGEKTQVARYARELDRAIMGVRNAFTEIKGLSRSLDDPRFRYADMHDWRLQNWLRAGAAFDQYVPLETDDPEPQIERGRIYLRLARLREEMGHCAQAEADYRQAEVTFQRLQAAASKEDSQQELAGLHNDLGRLLAQLGRLDAAEDRLRRASVLYLQLANDFPKRLDHRRDLAVNRLQLGRVLAAKKDLAEAERQCQQALELLQALATELPDDFVVHETLAEAYRCLSNIAGDQGRLADAEVACRRSLEEHGRLERTNAKEPDHRREQARVHADLARLLARKGQPTEAEAAWRVALTADQQLAADFPAVPVHAINLGRDNGDLGALLAGLGRTAEALTCYDRAIAALDKVLQQAPLLTTARTDLCQRLSKRAALLERLGQAADANADRQRQRATLELNDAMMHLQRALTLARDGNHVEAAAELNLIGKRKDWPGDALFEQARVLALCAAASVTEPELYEDYAALAVAVLGQAKAAGFFQAKGQLSTLNATPEFAALRKRRDFDQTMQP